MQDSSHCLNCGTTVHLNYCANCGQETRLHVPSAREFIHEFVTHYIAIEGKLWRTLKLLLFKPGKLTTEYLAGRRASYIIPLRIFLTFSILFFATMKLSNVDLVNSDVGKAGQEQQAPARGSAGDSARPDREAAAKPGRRDRSDLHELAEYIGPGAVAKIERVLDLPQEQRDKVIAAGFYSYAPYAMLLLMPVFALYLKLLYLGSGRRYGEHFLFALHTNAFAYLQITLMILSPWGFLTFLLGVWLVFYLPTAMRRVYGGSRIVTFLRWLVLAFLHAFSLSVAVLAALVLAMMA
ncbi:MAG TPA: DUF3667 domain-containing protein [Telluria sp.]